MADSKVSELTSATTVGGSDLLYIVQSDTSKKITVSTLFANTPNVTVKGTFAVDSSVQLLAAPGIIDVSKTITQLSVGATGGTCTIPAGLPGQLKYIVLTATSGGSYTVTGNIANNGQITFSTAGESAQLLYTNNKWFQVGGRASLS
jgi:hypothetical protein